MKIKNNKKIIASLLLLFLLLGLTGTVFAYWADGFSTIGNNKNEEVEIGDGEVVETTISISDINEFSKVLVPVGRATKDSQTEKLEFEMQVTWTSSDSNSQFSGLLDVVAKDYDELLNITIEGQGDIETGVAKTVKIIITLTEPETKEDYDRIAGKYLEFTLTFTVA